jgi:hypothetical protein
MLNVFMTKFLLFHLIFGYCEVQILDLAFEVRTFCLSGSVRLLAIMRSTF